MSAPRQRQMFQVESQRPASARPTAEKQADGTASESCIWQERLLELEPLFTGELTYGSK